MSNMNDMNNNMMNNNQDEDPKEKMRRKVKKAASIALCAVLAGGIAAGSYEGVSILTGWNSRNVSAASTTSSDEQNETVLKTAKKSSDSEDSGSETDSSEEDSSSDSSEADSDSSTTVKGSLDVSDIAAEGMKSVVAITTKSVQEVQNYLGYFGFGNGSSYTTQQEVEGSGSGIIVGKNDSELLIATNYHVIEDAETVSVTCIDGQVYEATVKGYDSDKDLAVVSVALSDISDDTMNEIAVATIGSSDDLKVGEQVVAIGNALGYGQSVTTGIVSAKNRKLDSNGQADDSSDGVNLIQTDAAINPGNSGGALLNMKGEVVGINSSKLASTEVEGMGYAIAISDVSDVLNNLMNETPRDKVDNHGVLGITGMTVSDEASTYYGVPEGILVSDVTEGGAADNAGIKAKSIITAFDGKRVRTIDALVEMLNYYKPGEEVEVTYQVADGDSYTEKTVTVTLGENTDKNSQNNNSNSQDSQNSNNSNDSQDNGNSDNSQDSQDNENSGNGQDQRQGGSTDSLLDDWLNGLTDGTSYQQYYYGNMW